MGRPRKQPDADATGAAHEPTADEIVADFVALNAARPDVFREVVTQLQALNLVPRTPGGFVA